MKNVFGDVRNKLTQYERISSTVYEDHSEDLPVTEKKTNIIINL